MTAMTLDRAQRETLRREIRIDTNGYGDIAMSIDVDRGDRGRTDRAYVVNAIENLTRWVAILDEIGWEDDPDEVGDQAVTIDSDFATWARDQIDELERSFRDFEPDDEDRSRLDVMRVLAEAVA